MNGRRIVFRIFPYDLEKWNNLDFDVIVVNNTAVSRLNDFYNASKDRKETVLTHLRKGHGVVEIADLTTTDINQPLQKEVFGLVSGAGSGGNVNFQNTNNASKISYDITKYFYGVGADTNFSGVTQRNLTLRTLQHPVRKNESSGSWRAVDIDLNRNGSYDRDELDFTEGESFATTMDGNTYSLGVDRIDVAGNAAHFNFLRTGEYNFSDFVGADPAAIAPSDGNADRIVASVSGGRNAVIIREFEGGRTAWISHGGGDDYRGLLKSSVLWAAGEGWNVLPRSVSARQVRVSSYVVQGEEFAEPYWIELTLWFLF